MDAACEVSIPTPSYSHISVYHRNCVLTCSNAVKTVTTCEEAYVFRDAVLDAGDVSGLTPSRSTPDKLVQTSTNKTVTGDGLKKKKIRQENAKLAAKKKCFPYLPLSPSASLTSRQTSSAAVKPSIRRCECLNRKDNLRAPARERSQTLQKTTKSRSATLGRSKPKSASVTGLTEREPTQESLGRHLPRSFSEEVLITPGDISPFCTYDTRCCYECKQRFKAGIWCTPRLVPHHYSTTVVLKINSTRKRYIDTVEFKTRLQPRLYTETVFTWPKVMATTYTTTLHQRGHKKLWYTSGLELGCQMQLLDTSTNDERRETLQKAKVDDVYQNCNGPVMTLNGTQ